MNGTAPDLEVVTSLLERAHAAGDARASYALATWYLFGKPPVIKRNLDKAYDFLETAAAKSIPEALFDLAIYLEKGTRGRKNLRRAFCLYVGAALRGVEQAVYEVGRCYYYGIGISQNRSLAEVWRLRAKELGITS